MTAGARRPPRGRASLSIALLLLVSSCALERPTSAVPTLYDFGPPPSHARSNPAIPATLLVTRVRAPSWLDESGIVYRLLYEDASNPRIYSMSRWSAPPAALISDRIYGRFAAASHGAVAPGFSAQSDYTIRLQLEDFSQHFTAADQSTVVLKVRASLLSSSDRRLIAQREFEFGGPADPNAAGAVNALTSAVDAFTSELVRWTAENVRSAQSAPASDKR
jgi:cholesterol transport system auxiliary component